MDADMDTDGLIDGISYVTSHKSIHKVSCSRRIPPVSSCNTKPVSSCNSFLDITSLS